MGEGEEAEGSAEAVQGLRPVRMAAEGEEAGGAVAVEQELRPGRTVRRGQKYLALLTSLIPPPPSPKVCLSRAPRPSWRRAAWGGNHVSFHSCDSLISHAVMHAPTYSHREVGHNRAIENTFHRPDAEFVLMVLDDPCMHINEAIPLLSELSEGSSSLGPQLMRHLADKLEEPQVEGMVVATDGDNRGIHGLRGFHAVERDG